MLTYDADLSVNLHFEISEEEAVTNGGISLSDVKKQIQDLPDWIMSAIMEYVEFKDNDSITVIPYSNELRMDGRIIRLDEIKEEDDEPEDLESESDSDENKDEVENEESEEVK